MSLCSFRTEKLFPLCVLLVLFFPPPCFVFADDGAALPAPEYDYPDGEFGEFSDDEFIPLEDEDGITVVGTIKTTQQITVIDKEEIEKHNAADLAVLLRETLNLSFTRYGGRGNMAGINMRGFDSKRVALLVDGVPVNSVIDGKIDVDQIDLRSVERIEVIHGGSDTKYNVSGALGGVINIVTVKKQDPGLSLGVSFSNTSALPGEYLDRGGKKQSPRWEDLGDTQNYGLDAAYGGNAFSFTAGVFANRAANHFLFNDYTGKTRRKDNNEVWDAGADASLVWDFPSLTKVIVSSGFFYGDKNIPSSGFSSLVGNQRDISTRHNLMLDMPRAFHDTLATEASLGYNFSDRTYISPEGAESRHNQHSALAVNRWSWYPGSRLVLRGGLDYRFALLDSTELGNRARHDGGVYFTAEWKPHSSFFVVPSVKAVCASGGAGGVTPVPKLGFLWNVNDSFSLKNNYFRSFKFPDFEELYWNGSGAYGNPDLLPEDGWGADLGAVWQFRELFNLESSFFSQWTKNSIHWYSGSDGIWRPENVGEAVFFGLDNKLRFEIPVSLGPVKKIIPSFSYQYLLSYLLSYGYGFSSDKRVPYMPVHTLGLSLEIPWSTGSLLVSSHYESPRYRDTGNLTGLDSHFLLDVIVNQKIGRNLSAFAAVRNLLNESYESFYDYPMPGLTLTLGLRANISPANLAPARISYDGSTDAVKS